MKVNHTLIFLILLLAAVTMSAQEVIFKVEVTTDSLYLGNPLGLKYTIENTQGDFEPPEFHGFDIVGGPNVASQFSMINGAVTQSTSYEYFLLPHDIGLVTISSAMLKNGEVELSSESISIVVLDNPNGVRQSTRGYGVSRTTVTGGNGRQMTKEDSLKMKLRKVKTKKI